MKKLLTTFILYFIICGNGYAFKDIKILEKIDLTVHADIKDVLNSIKDYNKNAVCEVSIVKQGDVIPTTARFSLNDNLYKLYDFFNKYKKPISIYCPKFNYKFKNKFNTPDVLGKEISLRFSICKNKVTKVDTMSFLNTSIYGTEPAILKKWISLFRNYSAKKPRKEVKEDRIRNIWVDTIFEDNKSEILYSILQVIEKDGLAYYDVSIIDLKKYSRCYL
ncbi:hypothetical protein N9377_03105 [Candidatus Pelagibacter sp.]|nr:hypothetical protein [Candidatus Pelagibacter sp.]